MRRYLLASALGIFSLGSCSATETTNTAWSANSDGEWLTRVVHRDTSGPGNGELSESVQLKNRAANEPVDVLTLEENTGPAMGELQWRDAKHLILTHAGGTVVLQVVKVGDVAIETRASAGERTP